MRIRFSVYLAIVACSLFAAAAEAAIQMKGTLMDPVTPNTCCDSGLNDFGAEKSSIAGVHFYDSPATVRRRLGRPSSNQTVRGRFIILPGRGGYGTCISDRMIWIYRASNLRLTVSFTDSARFTGGSAHCEWSKRFFVGKLATTSRRQVDQQGIHVASSEASVVHTRAYKGPYKPSPDPSSNGEPTPGCIIRDAGKSPRKMPNCYLRTVYGTCSNCDFGFGDDAPRIYESVYVHQRKVSLITLTYEPAHHHGQS